MAKLAILAAKYGFYIIVIVGAGFLTEKLTVIKRFAVSDTQASPDIMYNDSPSSAIGTYDYFLDRDYSKCFTEPRKTFCLIPIEKRLELFRNTETSPNIEEVELKLKNMTSSIQPLKRRIREALVDLNGIAEKVNMNLLVIEPSMLFCVLSSQEKRNLLRKFNPGLYQGSRNIVTLGLMRDDIKTLNESYAMNEILTTGFKIIKFRKWTKSWLQIEDDSEDSFETVHYFLVREGVIFHIVVFYRRGTYMWHFGLDTKEVDFDGLLFVNNGAFENFTIQPLNLNRISMPQMFIPSNTPYFLKELESSTYLACTNGTRNSPITNHPTLSAEQLHTRILIVLKELKKVLLPKMITFWMWAQTLMGWHKKCNILYYSTNLELSVTSKSMRSLKFDELFAFNEYLDLKSSDVSEMGLKYTFDCKGLLVNILILQEDDDGVWFSRTANGRKRLKLDMFSLCSTEILEQKINVPCNPEEILNSEYGKNWMDGT